MKRIIIFIISLFIHLTTYAQILPTYSDKFVDAVNLVKNNPTNKKDLEDAVSTFEFLKKDEYEKSYPILNYYEGKANRLLGRMCEDKDKAKENLLNAKEEFNEYKNFCLSSKKDARKEYKAAVIMLSYTLADLGNITGDYKEAKKEITEFMSDSQYKDLMDGGVTLCMADVFNAAGFYDFSNRKPIDALKEFKISCDLLKIGWPTYANNYLNACMDAFDETNDKSYLSDALPTYLIYKNKSYWETNDKFSKTGSNFEGYLQKYGIQPTSEK